MAPGAVQLPPELWHKILRNQVSFSVTETKTLSLVCRLFASIFQESLFQRLCMNANVGVDYKRNALFNPRPLQPLGSNRWPTQELLWEEWERSMVDCILSERRISLIGNHELLAHHPRSLRVHGYGSGQPFPLDPFQLPLENQALSSTVFDAFTHFRRTFLDTLPAFANLRRLELFGYPIEANLLKALDTHPSMTELSFDFCWFPDRTTPMTSITSLSFGYIPGSDTPHPSQGSNVDYHHTRSAFDLISPPHIKALDVSFGARGRDTAFVFEEFCARVSGKGLFLALQSLTWRFRGSGSGDLLTLPSPAIIQFLGRTPGLRSLSVQGRPPTLPLSQPFPVQCLPLLQSLFCPVAWARHLVPGRPVNTVRLYTPVEPLDPAPLAKDEKELNDFFGPFKQSASHITTLHLPVLPPLAPVWLLFPYLSSEFPSLHDLKVSVTGKHVAQPVIRRRHRFSEQEPPLYSIDATDQYVEGELLDVLERDVRNAVHIRLTGGASEVKQPHIVDRVMAFRGIAPTISRPEEAEPLDEIVQMQALRSRPMSGATDNRSRPSETFLGAMIGLPPPAVETQKPILTSARFDEMFRELDVYSGVPRAKPECALDVVYFLARGYYTLPSSLRSLTLLSCLQEGRRWGYSGRLNMLSCEDHIACTEDTLGMLSGAYPELSAFAQSTVTVWRCPVQFYGKHVNDAQECIWKLECSTTSDPVSLNSLAL